MTMTKESQPSTPLPPSSPGAGGALTGYRPDQGRHVRMAAFWAVSFFLIFGCRFLHDLLIQWPSMRTALGGVRIPVVGVDLTPAFLLTFTLFAVGMIVIRRWQQKPRVADLLIETEAELRKVSWPKPMEVWNASLVVIVSVVLLGAFLALADAFLFRVMRYLILGG